MAAVAPPDKGWSRVSIVSAPQPSRERAEAPSEGAFGRLVVKAVPFPIFIRKGRII